MNVVWGIVCILVGIVLFIFRAIIVYNTRERGPFPSGPAPFGQRLHEYSNPDGSPGLNYVLFMLAGSFVLAGLYLLGVFDKWLSAPPPSPGQ